MGRESAFKMVGATPTAAPRGTVQPPPPAAGAPVETQQQAVNTQVQAPDTTKTELESSKIAILAKKESALQKEREAYKKEREAWLKEKEQADAYKRKGEEFDELAKKDKIAALKLIGWSDTDIINALSNMEAPKEPTPEDIARKIAQEETLKFKEELNKEKEQSQKTENDRLISGLKSDISDTIKKNLEKYELSAFEGKAAEEQAYEFIVYALKEQGELISVDDALEMTELLYENRAEALRGLKKFQPKVEQTAAPDPRQEQRSRMPVSNVPQPKEQVMVQEQPRQRAPVRMPYQGPETREQKRDRLIKAIQTGGLTR